MQIDITLILFLIVALIFMASLAIYYWRRGKYQPTQLSQPKEASTPNYMSETDIEPNKIIFPGVEIARYQKTEMDNYEEIQLNEKTLIGFSSWFQQAPNLAQSGAQIMLNTYTLTFKPEIAKGIADGSLKIMESLDGGIRAVAVDGNNIMRGGGSLNPAMGLKSMAGVMAVWQVLAIVTAQKFLADINKQLEKIHKNLEEIKNFLENQQDAKLIGSLKYLQDIHDTLSSQSFDNVEFGAFLNQLEAIERECNEIMFSLERQMEKVHVDFKKQPLQAKLNIQEHLTVSRQLLTDYERLARSYLIAVAVKCLAYQTRYAILSNPNLTLRRLSTLKTDLSIWSENRRNFYELVGKRLPELNSWIDDGEDEQRQLELKLNRVKDSVKRMDIDIQKLVSETEGNIRNHLQEISQPVSLLVELNEDGQIVKTWKLRNNNSPV